MNLERNLTPKERKEYDVWLLEMQDTIRLKPIENETPAQKKKRIKKQWMKVWMRILFFQA